MSDMTTKQMTDYLSGDLEPFPWSIEFAIIARIREADTLEAENKQLRERWGKLRGWAMKLSETIDGESVIMADDVLTKMDSLESEGEKEK